MDANSWTAELGRWMSCSMRLGNNEQEYYTNPPNNLFFQEGRMIIEARTNLLEARIILRQESKRRVKKFKFGRIDIRAILPKAKVFGCILDASAEQCIWWMAKKRRN